MAPLAALAPPASHRRPPASAVAWRAAAMPAGSAARASRRSPPPLRAGARPLCRCPLPRRSSGAGVSVVGAPHGCGPPSSVQAAGPAPARPAPVAFGGRGSVSRGVALRRAFGPPPLSLRRFPRPAPPPSLAAPGSGCAARRARLPALGRRLARAGGLAAPPGPGGPLLRPPSLRSLLAVGRSLAPCSLRCSGRASACPPSLRAWASGPPGVSAPGSSPVIARGPPPALFAATPGAAAPFGRARLGRPGAGRGAAKPRPLSIARAPGRGFRPLRRAAGVRPPSSVGRGGLLFKVKMSRTAQSH